MMLEQSAAAVGLDQAEVRARMQAGPAPPEGGPDEGAGQRGE
jgi:hypothetical protein